MTTTWQPPTFTQWSFAINKLINKKNAVPQAVQHATSNAKNTHILHYTLHCVRADEKVRKIYINIMHFPTDFFFLL